MGELEKSMQIKRVTLVDQAAMQLKKYISEKRLIAGDKLPSEAELTEMLGVNRFTVRMALQKLSALGLIETKVGEGSFVKDYSITSYLSELSDYYVSEKNMDEVYTLRKMIELECLKLLITKGSDDDIAEVRKAYDRYEATHYPVTSSQIKDAIEADLKFHYAICYYSGNKLLSQLFLLILPIVKQYIECIGEIRRNSPPEDQEDYHSKLMAAIEKRDWKASKQAYFKTTSDRFLSEEMVAE